MFWSDQMYSCPCAIRFIFRGSLGWRLRPSELKIPVVLLCMTIYEPVIDRIVWLGFGNIIDHRLAIDIVFHLSLNTQDLFRSFVVLDFDIITPRCLRTSIKSDVPISCRVPSKIGKFVSLELTAIGIPMATYGPQPRARVSLWQYRTSWSHVRMGR